MVRTGGAVPWPVLVLNVLLSREYVGQPELSLSEKCVNELAGERETSIQESLILKT